MKLRLVFFAILLVPTLWANGPARSKEEFRSHVPLEQDLKLESDDLLLPSGELLPVEGPARIKLLEKFNKDYFELPPKLTESFTGKLKNGPEQKSGLINISDDENLSFQALMSSAEFQFRFEVNGEKVDEETYTVLLSPYLHTYLLRHNFLTMIGYDLPPVKYQKTKKVFFSSNIEKEEFLNKLAIDLRREDWKERWIIEESDDESSVTLKDLIITRTKWQDPLDHALSPPAGALWSRSERVLLVAYSLFNFKESVNQFPWFAGIKENQKVILPHMIRRTEFNASKNDILWMLDRMRDLSEDDFRKIVDHAYFPEDVSILLKEKIISRTKHLYQLFGQKRKDLHFNPDISDGENLNKGRLKHREFPEYATKFTFKHAKSPFDEMISYLLLDGQELLMKQGTNFINKFLERDNTNEKIQEFREKRFKIFLENYLETGKSGDIPLDTWNSTFAKAKLIAGRSVLIGGEFSQFSQIQLADTFGYLTSVGGRLGIEGFNLGFGQSQMARIDSSISFLHTFTHIRPVTSFKSAMNYKEEPYKNIFVPNVKKGVIKALKEIIQEAESKRFNHFKLAKKVELLNNYLAVGESLIINKKLVAGISGQINIYFDSVGNLNLGAGTNYIDVDRVTISRPEKNIIKVYSQDGDSFSINFHTGLNYIIPIISYSHSNVSGDYFTKVFHTPLEVENNDRVQFINSLKALKTYLKDLNVKVYEKTSRRILLDGKFNEKTSKFRIPFLGSIKQRESTTLDITTQSGKTGKYFRTSHTNLRGINYTNSAKEIAVDIYNYLEEEDFSLEVNHINDPSSTFLGSSHKVSVISEMALIEKDGEEEKKEEHKEYIVKSPMVKIVDTFSGHKLSRKKIRKTIRKINNKYEYEVFPENILSSAKSVRLYRMNIITYVYEEGIKNLEEITEEKLNEIFTGKLNHRCKRGPKGGLTSASKCSTLSNLKSKMRKCLIKKENSLHEKRYKCISNIVYNLHKYFPFKVFKEIVGANNYYTFPTVTGLRNKDEILTKLEKGVSDGKIRSKYWSGIWERIGKNLKISDYDLLGQWLREYL